MKRTKATEAWGAEAGGGGDKRWGSTGGGMLDHLLFAFGMDGLPYPIGYQGMGEWRDIRNYETKTPIYETKPQFMRLPWYLGTLSWYPTAVHD
jgi:hypothetical protein